MGGPAQTYPDSFRECCWALSHGTFICHVSFWVMFSNIMFSNLSKKLSAQIRAGVVGLHIKTGRYVSIVKEDTICPDLISLNLAKAWAIVCTDECWCCLLTLRCLCITSNLKFVVKMSTGRIICLVIPYWMGHNSGTKIKIFNCIIHCWYDHCYCFC